jgi:hypothetical protein
MSRVSNIPQPIYNDVNNILTVKLRVTQTFRVEFETDRSKYCTRHKP